jgi:hypothetical protein
MRGAFEHERTNACTIARASGDIEMCAFGPVCVRAHPFMGAWAHMVALSDRGSASMKLALQHRMRIKHPAGVNCLLCEQRSLETNDPASDARMRECA